MSTILKYKIENLEILLTEFLSVVDTSVDYNDFSLNPWITNSDYFGKISFGKFIFYHKVKLLLQPRVILEIRGQIKENIFSLTIKYHNLWYFITNTIVLTVFSVFMMTTSSIYFGLILLIITIVQTLFGLRLYIKRKQKFIELIEGIIKKTNV